MNIKTSCFNYEMVQKFLIQIEYFNNNKTDLNILMYHLEKVTISLSVTQLISKNLNELETVYTYIFINFKKVILTIKRDIHLL